MGSNSRRYKNRLILPIIVAAMFGTATGANAKDLSIADLHGRWCGEISDYTFTSKRLKVEFHAGRDDRILKIAKVVVNKETIQVYWVSDKSESGTFFKLSKDYRTLFQQPNTSGDMGPLRIFKRC